MHVAGSVPNLLTASPSRDAPGERRQRNSVVPGWVPQFPSSRPASSASRATPEESGYPFAQTVRGGPASPARPTVGRRSRYCGLEGAAVEATSVSAPARGLSRGSRRLSRTRRQTPVGSARTKQGLQGNRSRRFRVGQGLPDAVNRSILVRSRAKGKGQRGRGLVKNFFKSGCVARLSGVASRAPT